MYDPIASLKAKVEAVNLANATVNELYDKLASIFTHFVGKKVVTKDGSLIAKLDGLVKGIGLPYTGRLRVCRHASNYSLAWSVYTSIPIAGDCGTASHEQVCYVGNLQGDVLESMTPKYNYRTDFTFEVVAEARKVAKAAGEAYSKAKDACSPFGE